MFFFLIRLAIYCVSIFQVKILCVYDSLCIFIFFNGNVEAFDLYLKFQFESVYKNKMKNFRKKTKYMVLYKKTSYSCVCDYHC